jgi:hypothetical protein
LKPPRTEAEVARSGPAATDRPAGRVGRPRGPQWDNGGPYVLSFHAIMIAHIMPVAPDLLGVAPAQRTYGVWWQGLAAMCCAVAPPRGKDAGSFRECFARGPAAPGSPGSWWRHASGNSANGRNAFSGSPTFTSFLPGDAHRAFAHSFTPARHISPESAQRRNTRLKPFSDRSLDGCAGVLHPTVGRNTRGAARAAAAADRIRRRVGVIAERIDAGGGREGPAAGCGDDGRALAASPGIRQGRARSPPPWPGARRRIRNRG